MRPIYKAGDRVRVKDRTWDKYSFQEKMRYMALGFRFTPDMAKYCGNILTIKHYLSPISSYLVEENSAIWPEEMFEGLDKSRTIAEHTNKLINQFLDLTVSNIEINGFNVQQPADQPIKLIKSNHFLPITKNI